ncbi:MAG: HEPN domain-containing protein [Phycisphaerae bacterium]
MAQQPMSPSQVFLAKAREDLYQVEKNKGDANVSDEQFGFFCQQAVEKSLKAVLTQHQVRFRRGHDLTTYLDLLTAAGVPYPPELEESVELTPFGAELRYDFLPPSDSTPLDRAASRGSHGWLSCGQRRLCRRRKPEQVDRHRVRPSSRHQRGRTTDTHEPFQPFIRLNG